MNTKYLISGLCAIIVIFGVYGIYEALKPIAQVGSASAVGVTNNAPRVAQVVCANTSTSTYASFLNTDASDRIITSLDVFLTGISVSAFSNLDVGTSTVPSGTSSTAYYYHATGIATTTDPVFVASSTPVSSGVRVWATGTYLNAVANATSTGYCVIRVGYIPE